MNKLMPNATFQRSVADYRNYPRICSDDGRFMVSGGYTYMRTEETNFGRPVYTRLNLIQTYPNCLPQGTFGEVQEFLRSEAQGFIDGLVDGSIPVVTNYRFKNCKYDEQGYFAGHRQGVSNAHRDADYERLSARCADSYSDRWSEESIVAGWHQ